MTTKRPIFLFAFANDAQSSLRLGEEQNACWNELAELHEAGKIDCRQMGFATLEQIYREFNRSSQIHFFHYGGHSDSELIKLQGTAGTAQNLGAKIGQQKNLKLVFLNGCKNHQQVQALFAHGVSAMIATTAKVEDIRAIDLAKQFYQALAGGNSIQQSFDSARAFIQDTYPELAGTFRSIVMEEEAESDNFAWGLFAQDHAELNWSVNDIETDPFIGYDDRKVKRLLTKLPVLEDQIIGREADIKQLKETLEKSQEVVLLSGMGKNNTTIAYSNQFKEQYKHIACIEQLTDFSTDIIANKVLLENLGIHPTDDPVGDTQLVLNSLSNLGGKSLLVIDNANEQIEAFKDYLPKAPDWHVLITSRQELDFAQIIPLNFLSEEKAIELFYAHYDRDKEEAIVKEIVQTIDYHTLTIELLAKTAQKRRIQPLSKLADMLREKGLVLGRRLDFSIAHSGTEKVELLFPYLKAIFQIDESSTEEEIRLLKQFVGLPPIFISYTDLIQLLQIDLEDDKAYDDFNIALDQLKDKGWLSFDKGKEAYKMHRIIQDAMQEQLQPDYTDLGTLVEGVSSCLSIDEAVDNPIDKFIYVPFGERLLQLFSSPKEESFSNFQSNLAVVYRNLGRYEEAAGLLEKALASDQASLGEAHVRVARRQSNLALVYRYLRRYEEAAGLLEKALTSAQSNFGAAHPSVATIQSNLALVYKDLRRYEEAAGLLEKALSSDQTNYGEAHPSVARSQSNLAMVYKDLGRYEEAAGLLEKALASDQANFGEAHPSVATIQSNLALVYRDLGRHEEAASLLEKALASDQANFGEAHPSVATIQSNLALVYQDLGRYEEAIAYFFKALKIMINFFGEGHPHVNTIQNNILKTLENGAAAGNEYCIKWSEKMGLE